MHHDILQISLNHDHTGNEVCFCKHGHGYVFLFLLREIKSRFISRPMGGNEQCEIKICLSGLFVCQWVTDEKV